MFGSLKKLISSNQETKPTSTKAHPQAERLPALLWKEDGTPEIPASDNAQANYEYGYYWEFLADERDIDRAGFYYEKAALLNHTKAQYRLGKFYENPHRSCGASTEVAHHWYEVAAQNGSRQARTALSVLLLRSIKRNRA